VIAKGYAHLKTQLSQTLPTQLQRASYIRRYAVQHLQKGKL